jgi:hypothetical protein
MFILKLHFASFLKGIRRQTSPASPLDKFREQVYLKEIERANRLPNVDGQRICHNDIKPRPLSRVWIGPRMIRAFL